LVNLSNKRNNQTNQYKITAMNILKKIKSHLDEKIEQDKQKDGNGKIDDNLSVKSLIDGKILISNTFRRIYPLLLLLMGLAFWYINNRFQYESLVRQNNNLKEQQKDLENVKLLKIKDLKMTSIRSEVNRKLAELGSKVTAAKTPPVKVD
jgi:hypothetical protein